jgi:hypothetical protein
VSSSVLFRWFFVTEARLFLSFLENSVRTQPKTSHIISKCCWITFPDETLMLYNSRIIVTTESVSQSKRQPLSINHVARMIIVVFVSSSSSISLQHWISSHCFPFHEVLLQDAMGDCCSPFFGSSWRILHGSCLFLSSSRHLLECFESNVSASHSYLETPLFLLCLPTCSFHSILRDFLLKVIVDPSPIL